MARLAAVAKMGHYPTPTKSPEYIRHQIVNSASRGEFHYLDPCCGEGYALNGSPEITTPPPGG